MEARRSAANLTRQIYQGAAWSAAETSGTANTSAAVWIERGTCKTHAIIQQKPIAQNASKTPRNRSAVEVACLSTERGDALLTHLHTRQRTPTHARPKSGGVDSIRKADKAEKRTSDFRRATRD